MKESETIDENNNSSSRNANSGENNVSGINKIINNNIISYFNRKTNGERRRDININFYNIINNIDRLRNYIRVRALRFFVNKTYDNKSVNRLTLYCFEYYIDFRSSIELYAKLQLSSIYKYLVYIS